MKNKIYLLGVTMCLFSCSKKDSVEVKNIETLEVTNLIYPTNNLLCVTNKLEFKWEAPTNSKENDISYILEVSKDNFTNIVELDTVTTTTHELNLETGLAYYWRVKAIDSKNRSSDYSSVYQFYTEGVGVVNHLPFSPELIAPQIDDVVVEEQANLLWKATDVDKDTLTYNVYFGIENPPINTVSENQKENNFLVNLNKDTTYYWKVTANDGKGGITIGQIWHFRTK